jgi:excinuclease ABC subunit A
VSQLRISNATRHNLQNLSVEIPLGRLVALTGVSGSGKSTLIRDILLPALQSKLQNLSSPIAKASDRLDSDTDSNTNDDETANLNPSSSVLSGHESLGQVVLVDQSALGKTPRSNPAVYIGAFDDIREVFAQSEVAKQRGLNASAFSFNSGVGQCEKCRGAGFEKIEMQFLSDIFIRCPECNGRRYRQHILEVKIAAPKSKQEFSIGDMLEATVDEAIDFLAGFPDSKPAQRASTSLKLLQEVGLGYLRLGQPINTLSGGESQRLKLVRHLAESVAAVCDRQASEPEANGGGHRPPLQQKPTLFLFDEPTTGLHFDDVRLLLQVFQRLVAAGHSVLVIEHNLDVIKCADWVIDLGPEAGDRGGQVVAQGTPEEVASHSTSFTGQHLKSVLKTRSRKREAKVP